MAIESSNEKVPVAAVPHWSRTWKRPALVVAMLAAVGLVVAHGISKGEFNLNTDEAHHAFTGMYFADLLRDLPLKHPVFYTYEYYARYPALGLVHWPPFFPLVEGIAFLSFGPSVTVARMVVLLFLLLGLYFWFKLVCELQNEQAALISALCLGFLPSLLLYEKAAMLEIPSLSLCIAATYFWVRYLQERTAGLLYWFAFLASLAVLTKQHSIYLVVFCFLTAAVQSKLRDLLSWATVKALGICILMLGPFYALTWVVHLRLVGLEVTHALREISHPWIYYPRLLPLQLGWPLLLLSVIGLATWRWWGTRRAKIVMLSWIVACYVTFTPIALKEPRYILDWIPPFVYLAVMPLTSKSQRPWLRPVAAAVIVLLLGNEAWSAWRYQRPYVSGYAPAARYVTELDHPGIVLYDGDLAANFIFYVRVFDSARQCIVMRKALYVTDIAKEYGKDELVQTRQQLEATIEEYGVKYVVVEDNLPLDFPVQGTLRDLLRTSQFKLVKTFPIDTNIPSRKGRSLLLYENTEAVTRTARLLRLKMLTLNHDIVVSLDDLLER